MSKAHRDPQYTANRRKVLANKPDCAYCGKPNADTVDHILELDAGGDHGLDNLAPCCANCNNIKGHRYVTARNQHRQHSRHESMQKNPVRNIEPVFYKQTHDGYCYIKYTDGAMFHAFIDKLDKVLKDIKRK